MLAKTHILIGCLLAIMGCARGADDSKSRVPTTAGDEFFETRVRPILAEKCISCHGPKKQMGGLRLDSGDAIAKGGDDGQVVRSGDPENSLLIQAIRQSGELKMPPKSKLAQEEIEALTTWVRQGA